MSRYVRRDRTFGPQSMCKLCGTGYGGQHNGMCDRTSCLACGTAQCVTNDTGAGICQVCYLGLLPGGSEGSRNCEYTGCTGRAMLRVAGDFRCLAHGSQRKVRRCGPTVAQAIEQVPSERETHWLEVADDGCVVIPP